MATSMEYVENVVKEPQNPTPNMSLARGLNPVGIKADVAVGAVDGGEDLGRGAPRKKKQGSKK